MDPATTYHLHVGPSILPRHGAQPLTLTDAIHQAYGHRYAVIYQLLGGAPAPIIADAGADEVIHVPTGQRIPRDTITRHTI